MSAINNKLPDTHTCKHTPTLACMHMPFGQTQGKRDFGTIHKDNNIKKKFLNLDLRFFLHYL